MWVLTEKGDLRNLSLAYKIEKGTVHGQVIVQAAFPICTGKNAADPAFVEIAKLKTFDNDKDATVYLGELGMALNDFGYAFNWLSAGKETVKKAEEKPIEKAKEKADDDLLDGAPL